MAKNAGTKKHHLHGCKSRCFDRSRTMVNGSLIQFFLTNRSVSVYYVGLFSTLVSIITVADMMHWSYLSEKLPMLLKQYPWLYFLHMAV